LKDDESSFYGYQGRLETRPDIPWLKQDKLDQQALHALEMDQRDAKSFIIEPLIVFMNSEDDQTVYLKSEQEDHGGGDQRLQEKVFKNPETPDSLSYGSQPLGWNYVEVNRRGNP